MIEATDFRNATSISAADQFNSLNDSFTVTLGGKAKRINWGAALEWATSTTDNNGGGDTESTAYLVRLGAAAKKWDLLSFASISFCVRVSSSCELSSTFLSSVMLASCNARSALRCAVISVKLVTKPPLGIGRPCIAITLPLGSSRSV